MSEAVIFFNKRNKQFSIRMFTHSKIARFYISIDEKTKFQYKRKMPILKYIEFDRFPEFEKNMPAKVKVCVI